MSWIGKLLLTGILLGLPAGVAQESAPKDKKEGTSAKPETIVGVVDQTGDTFVIAGEDRIRPIAKLKAEGFSDSNFARFVGLKVRIRGQLATSGSEKVLRVRALKDIETIGPTSKK